MAWGREKKGGDSDVAKPAPVIDSNVALQEKDIVYPTGWRFAVLMISVFISMFLVSLDRLIIATAIPTITDEFHSANDIGWYGSAYLLTQCALQLLFGKLYTLYSVRYVYLVAILIFEVGSALCGAAPSSEAFIVGRAIAGVGAAGIFSGAIVSLVYAVPLHKRPTYQGLFGAIFGLSSIIGPLVGGAFTTSVTWRWCFYINLPIGGAAMLFIGLLMQVPDRPETHRPTMEKLRQLDVLGTLVLVPGIVCLVLALQWGGLTYPWNEGRIIALLVVAGFLLICFVVIQIVFPDTATVPPHILTQRSIMAAFWATFCIGSQMMIFVYFLPIWFQVIQETSAIQSGIRLLATVLPMVFGSIFTGGLTEAVGYYTPFMLVGSCLISIGAGLLTTLQLDTSQGRWIGYQVLYGFGMGLTFQAPNLAAQTVLPLVDVPIGSALMFFSQLLGGAVFVSVGQNVLSNDLVSRLSAAFPGFGASDVIGNGTTTYRPPANASEAERAFYHEFLVDYNESLRKVFQIGLIMACLTLFGALAMEWKSIKEGAEQAKVEAATSPEHGTAAVTVQAETAAAGAAGGETKAEGVREPEVKKV